MPFLVFQELLNLINTISLFGGRILLTFEVSALTFGIGTWISIYTSVLQLCYLDLTYYSTAIKYSLAITLMISTSIPED